ncbi:NUDIX domain-containing protein [Olivibacter sp. XZL3]|uniref:NUDIX hydrolase n=1 Tax=Olivibacter sp. XZL3 TaxID=1735116 RepID=UPI00106575FC|nr:NUDIX domain-containing protein [Olivibacter sp. XZL3]
MIDKLAWIEIRNNRILSTRSKGKDTYYLPGGKRELGESDIEALMREIAEELTVQIDLHSIKFYGEFAAQAHGHPDGVMVTMRCYTASYSGLLQPAAEIEEIAWLTYRDKPRVSQVDKIIFDDLKAKGLLR